jgi:tetratricopeptide (TPR) repeat protein
LHRPTTELADKVRQAIALHVNGHNDRASAAYREILAIDPAHPEVLSKLAALCIQSGSPQEAVALLGKVLRIDPRSAVNYSNLGAALEKLNQWNAALHCYSQAIAINSNLAEAHCNRANVLRELKRWPEALAGYDMAITLRPNYVNAFINRGNVLKGLKRWQEALASYHQAIVIKPDSAPANYNRALIRLMLGDYEAGWADYEWRWKHERLALVTEKREFRHPRWTGAESIAGKTLFIYSEQGLGDTIQFCRYVPLAVAQCANVIFEVQPPLTSLLASIEGVARVVEAGEPLPDFDYHCALMSLPLACRTTLATVPAQVPYLSPDVARSQMWGKIVGKKSKLRVGLTWSSGVRPNQHELREFSHRNIPLAKLAALNHPNIEYYSLQKGQAAEYEFANMVAANTLDLRITNLTNRLNDFADTAALMESLDLVISVDTATAHLAGALGKPVWILLCFNACWRWLRNRADSPWYPTARLYRQTRDGDWEDVIDRVNRDLVQLTQ